MKIAFEHHLKERPGVSMGVSLRAKRPNAPATALVITPTRTALNSHD